MRIPNDALTDAQLLARMCAEARPNRFDTDAYSKRFRPCPEDRLREAAADWSDIHIRIKPRER